MTSFADHIRDRHRLARIRPDLTPLPPVHRPVRTTDVAVDDVMPLPRRQSVAATIDVRTVDDRGRVTIGCVTDDLGWTIGDTVLVARLEDHIRVRAAAGGPDPGERTEHIRRSWRLPLRRAERDLLRLSAGDSVVVLVDDDRQQVRIYPPAEVVHALESRATVSLLDLDREEEERS